MRAHWDGGRGKTCVAQDGQRTSWWVTRRNREAPFPGLAILSRWLQSGNSLFCVKHPTANGSIWGRLFGSVEWRSTQAFSRPSIMIVRGADGVLIRMVLRSGGANRGLQPRGMFGTNTSQFGL